jgi:hypothetical protein
MSMQSGTWSEVIFSNGADGTAVASTASEASLLGGLNNQPTFRLGYFTDNGALKRVTTVKASGVFSNTGTPTLIFQLRLGSTSGSSTLSGTSLGVSAAITTANGVTNKYWELNFDFITTVSGIGSNNTTISGGGIVLSPGGFASPFTYPLEPTTPDTGTWTQTFDGGVTQFLNLSVTWSASSASNSITMKKLWVGGLN